MSVRKIRKAGQRKAFMAATYKGGALFAYTKHYGAHRFPHIIPKAEPGMNKLFDAFRRKKNLC